MSPSIERRAVLRVLASSLHGHKAELTELVGWSLVEAGPAFLSGRLVALAVDRGFLHHQPLFGLGLLGMLGLNVLVSGWATGRLYPLLAALVEPLRDRLVALSVKSAIYGSSGKRAVTDTAAVARVTRQVEIVRETYASLMAVVQSFVVTTISAAVGLASLAPAALVLVLPPLALGLALFFVSLSRTAARQQDSIVADEHLSETSSIMVRSRRDIVATGGEESIESAMGGHIDAQARATWALARLTAVRSMAVSAGGLLPIVLVLAGAPWLIEHGATTGTILGVLTYVLTGIHPALQSLVRGVSNNGMWLMVALERILGAAEPDGTPGAVRCHSGPDGAARHIPAPCDLELRDVTFRYGPGAEPIVRDLSLVVPAGTHLAIAGPSGVGKSTLAGLVSGMLAPQTGAIRLGGVDLSDVDDRVLVVARVLIPQEAYVFAGSLAENIGYLRPDAPSSDVEQALDVLGARSLVDRMGGLEAELDPSVLSAGEQQLLTLVRAYLSPASLVILDEATCHLDAISEARVERAFARRGGTLLVIAHRMSSALRAEQILLMDGERTTLGVHDELLARSELYRDLMGYWNGGPALGEGRSAGRGIEGVSAHVSSG